MGGTLEDSLGGDEPLRHVLQRALPQIRGVVGVVVVDEYHGVGRNAIACMSVENFFFIIWLPQRNKANIHYTVPTRSSCSLPSELI